MGGAHGPRVRRVMAEPRPGGETKREEGSAGFRRAGPFAETLDKGRRKSQSQTTFPEDCRQDAGRGGEQGQGPETDPRQPPSPRDHKLLHCCGKPGARNPLTAGYGTALPGECHTGLSAAPARLGARRTLLPRLALPLCLERLSSGQPGPGAWIHPGPPRCLFTAPLPHTS